MIHHLAHALPDAFGRIDHGRRAGFVRTALVLAVLLWSVEAAAAGFYLPLRGVRPTGRAGAVAVSGGGPHALWYNPAQLLALDGTHILVDVGLAALNTTFSRSPSEYPSGDLLTFAPVENSNAPAVIPNLIAVTDFGLDRFGFGLGFMAPYGTLSTYPAEGAQRYSLIQNAETAAFLVGLGVAYEITDWFRIGASFQGLYVSTKMVLTASAYQGIFGQPEDLDLDLRFSIKAVDPFTPMGNFGLWFQLAEGFELAIAAQLGGEIVDDAAKLEVRMATHPFFDNAELDGDSVAAGLKIPAMIRGGLRWVHGRGDVELNVAWEGWSVHDQIRADPGVIRLTGVFGVDEFLVGSLNVPKEWQDTWALSLGSDFIAIPDRLTVRAGVVWEQGAIPANRFNVFSWDVDKIAPTIGLSVEFPDVGLTLDAAFTHFFMFDQNIDDSLVEQINPTFEEGAVIVGNGQYQGNINLFGLGAEVAF